MNHIKDGGPAFPVADPMGLEPGTVAEMKRLASGMTLRDYFAVRAPTEIPAWFKGPSLRVVVRPTPPEAIAKEAEAWDRDGCYDLDSLFEDSERKQLACTYMDAVHQYGRDVVAANREQQQAHYFAWRWHYADAMLRARGAL